VINLPGFLAVAVILIVTPGQDTALTIRNTLAGGRSSGIWTAAGVAAGQTTWALLTAAGLAALVVTVAPVFTALRYIGAAYLCFLGLQALWAAHRRRKSVEAEPSLAFVAPRLALQRGFISNITNPKMVVFFPSLLPQFLAPAPGFALAAIALGLLFSLMTFTWLTGYSWFVAKLGDLLRRSEIRRAMDAILGTVLVGLGLRLALERR
jgi:threonine/homoserine/homoserine lactone efflux protein